MSLIDLSRRHSRDPETFERRRSADNSVLLVAEPGVVERYAIELSIGENWSRRYGPRSNGMVRINTDGITIPPGGSVVVEAAESIRVPYNMYGLVIPTGSLFLDDAIIIAAAKIEPAFMGKLKLRLVNSSGEARVVKQGRKIASGIFFATETTVRHDDVQKKAVAVETLPSRGRRLLRWTKDNPTVVPIVAAVISMLAAAAAITTASVNVATYRDRLNTLEKRSHPTESAEPPPHDTIVQNGAS